MRTNVEFSKAVMQEIDWAVDNGQILAQPCNDAVWHIVITGGTPNIHIFDMRWPISTKEGRLSNGNMIYVNGQLTELEQESVDRLERISQELIFVAKLNA